MVCYYLLMSSKETPAPDYGFTKPIQEQVKYFLPDGTSRQEVEDHGMWPNLSQPKVDPDPNLSTRLPLVGGEFRI